MAAERAQNAPQAVQAGRSARHLGTDVVLAGKYRLLRPAGPGERGAVWIARQEGTDNEAAVSLLELRASDPEASARACREIVVAARLSHPGIARVLDVIELDVEQGNALAIVTEVLRGEALATVINKRPEHRLDLGEGLGMALAILAALAFGHAAGVVHGDLTPNGVVLSPGRDGRSSPKILAFGISKEAGQGTPRYMSPEQARGSTKLEPTSDVFSMGILLCEMLGGQHPFAASGDHAVIAAILERDPEPIPGIPRPIWDVIARALQKNPEKRFATARDFAAALRSAGGVLVPAQWQSPRGMTDPAMALPYRRSAPTILDEHGLVRRRHRLRRTVMLLLTGCLVLAGAAVALRMRLRAVAHPPDRAPAPEVTVSADARAPGSAPAADVAASVTPPASPPPAASSVSSTRALPAPPRATPRRGPRPAPREPPAASTDAPGSGPPRAPDL